MEAGGEVTTFSAPELLHRSLGCYPGIRCNRQKTVILSVIFMTAEGSPLRNGCELGWYHDKLSSLTMEIVCDSGVFLMPGNRKAVLHMTFSCLFGA